jgi:hypothetical protein
MQLRTRAIMTQPRLSSMMSHIVKTTTGCNRGWKKLKDLLTEPQWEGDIVPTKITIVSLKIQVLWTQVSQRVPLKSLLVKALSQTFWAMDKMSTICAMEKLAWCLITHRRSFSKSTTRQISIWTSVYVLLTWDSLIILPCNECIIISRQYSK